tara:strand:+ start:1282 stop:1743 length:462 start_codon:yes stop_codon:yes gene_type:complete
LFHQLLSANHVNVLIPTGTKNHRGQYTAARNPANHKKNFPHNFPKDQKNGTYTFGKTTPDILATTHNARTTTLSSPKDKQHNNTPKNTSLPNINVRDVVENGISRPNTTNTLRNPVIIVEYSSDMAHFPDMSKIANKNKKTKNKSRERQKKQI